MTIEEKTTDIPRQEFPFQKIYQTVQNEITKAYDVNTNIIFDELSSEFTNDGKFISTELITAPNGTNGNATQFTLKKGHTYHLKADVIVYLPTASYRGYQWYNTKTGELLGVGGGTENATQTLEFDADAIVEAKDEDLHVAVRIVSSDEPGVNRTVKRFSRAIVEIMPYKSGPFNG